MRKVGLFICFITLMLFFGCASLSPKIVEKSGSKEKWVKSENIYFEEKDSLYFRGEVSGAYDLALGKRQAEADAKKRLVEAIQSEITGEYREFTRGSNAVPGDVGRFVEDALESVSEGTKVSGMLAEKTYWERLVDGGEKEGAKPYYRIYALLKIGKKDFEGAKGRVVSELLERARSDRNREAEQMIEEWKKKREKGLSQTP